MTWAKLSDSLSWSQGHGGKGYLLYDGTIKTWNSDPYEPFDQRTVFERNHEQSPIALNFDIDPDGGIVTGEPSTKVETIINADPRLYDAGQRPVFEDNFDLDSFEPTSEQKGKPDYNFIMSSESVLPISMHGCPKCHAPLSDAQFTEGNVGCPNCGYVIPYDGWEQLEGFHQDDQFPEWMRKNYDVNVDRDDLDTPHYGMALDPQDAQAYIDKYGPYLEHWTKAESVPSIMRQGIQPGTHAADPANDWDEWSQGPEEFNPTEGDTRRQWDGYLETRPGYTYLARPGTLSPGMHENHLKQRPYEVPLRVDLRKLDHRRLEADEDAAKDLWPEWRDREREKLRQQYGHEPDDWEPSEMHEPPDPNLWSHDSESLGDWAGRAGLDDPQWTNDSLGQGTISYDGHIPPEALSLHPDWMHKYPAEVGGNGPGQMPLFSSVAKDFGGNAPDRDKLRMMCPLCSGRGGDCRACGGQGFIPFPSRGDGSQWPEEGWGSAGLPWTLDPYELDEAMPAMERRQGAAEADELHIGLEIPAAVTKQIKAWVDDQEWPEGTKKEDPSDYHITLMYSPEGREEHGDADWEHTDGYPVSVSGIDEFGDDDEKAIVLRIESPQVKGHANAMQTEAEAKGLEISKFPGGYKPHLTIAYGPGKPTGSPPKLKFRTGPSSVSPPRTSAWHFADGPYGYTNYDTSTVALIMDNEEALQNASRKIVEQGGTPEDLRNWALRKIISPHNREQIKGAQEWNDIPYEERQRRIRERDISQFGEDAVNLGQSLMQPFADDANEGKSDEEIQREQEYEAPDLIDPELVNWDELHQGILNEFDENAEYERQEERNRASGLGWANNGGDYQDQMRDAFYRFHGAVPEEEIQAELGPGYHSDDPRNYNRRSINIPFEHIQQLPDWAEHYGDARSAIWDYRYPRAEQKAREELLGHGLAPEKVEEVLNETGAFRPDYTRKYFPGGKYDAPINLDDPGEREAVMNSPGVQQLQQGGYDMSLSDLYGDVKHAITHGQPHPYVGQMQQALQQQNYTPEQIAEIMRQRWRWDEEQKQRFPVDAAPPLDQWEEQRQQQQALDQPGNLTIPEGWTSSAQTWDWGEEPLGAPTEQEDHDTAIWNLIEQMGQEPGFAGMTVDQLWPLAEARYRRMTTEPVPSGWTSSWSDVPEPMKPIVIQPKAPRGDPRNNNEMIYNQIGEAVQQGDTEMAKWLYQLLPDTMQPIEISQAPPGTPLTNVTGSRNTGYRALAAQGYPHRLYCQHCGADALEAVPEVPQLRGQLLCNHCKQYTSIGLDAPAEQWEELEHANPSGLSQLAPEFSGPDAISPRRYIEPIINELIPQGYQRNNPTMSAVKVADADHMLAPAVELREWLADLGGSEPEAPSIHHDTAEDTIMAPAATQRTDLPYFPPANVPKEYKQGASSVPTQYHGNIDPSNLLSDGYKGYAGRWPTIWTDGTLHIGPEGSTHAQMADALALDTGLNGNGDQSWETGWVGHNPEAYAGSHEGAPDREEFEHNGVPYGWYGSPSLSKLPPEVNEAMVRYHQTFLSPSIDPNAEQGYGHAQRLTREAMAERSGWPELDQAIEQFMQSRPDLEDYRDPQLAWGRCQEIADECAAFLKERGFTAYATSDEVGAFDGYQDAQDSAAIGAGQFSYPEHAMVEVYGEPGMGVLHTFIDFTASQYGFTEFPKVHGPHTASLHQQANESFGKCVDCGEPIVHNNDTKMQVPPYMCSNCGRLYMPSELEVLDKLPKMQRPVNDPSKNIYGEPHNGEPDGGWETWGGEPTWDHTEPCGFCGSPNTGSRRVPRGKPPEEQWLQGNCKDCLANWSINEDQPRTQGETDPTWDDFWRGSSFDDVVADRDRALAWEMIRTADSSQRLYHHSPLDNDAAIREHGLLTSRDFNAGVDESYTPGIYLTTHPEPEPGMAVYEVDATGLPLEPDPTVGPDTGGEITDPAGSEWYISYQDIPPDRLRRVANIKTADSPITQADATNDALGKSPALIPGRDGDPDYLKASICPNCLQTHRPDEPCPDSSVTQYKQQERQWYNRDPNAIHGAPDGLQDHQADLGKLGAMPPFWEAHPEREEAESLHDPNWDPTGYFEMECPTCAGNTPGRIPDSDPANRLGWKPCPDCHDQGTEELRLNGPVRGGDGTAYLPKFVEPEWTTLAPGGEEMFGTRRQGAEAKTASADPALTEIKESLAKLAGDIANMQKPGPPPEGKKPRKLKIHRDAAGRMESIEEV